MYKKLLCLVLFTVLFGVVEAQAVEITWIRAAWYDAKYPTNWATDADAQAVRDGLKAAGYEILDSAQLKTWMTARISDKKLSVVVLCKDVPPDTVAETESATCTLRKYLDAGGRVVVYADIPFYNIGHADGSETNWAEGGPTAILGIGTVSVWDTNNTVKITAAGTKWGLTTTWASVRPYAASNTGFTILATDNAGNAAAWVKSFGKSGSFVRLWDRGGHPPVADIISVAEFMNLKASNPRPANGATGVLVPAVLQWDPSNFAVKHVLYLGTTPTLGAADKKTTLNVTQLMYYAQGLESGTTYYWRIDEIESDQTVRTGDVWSFATAPVKAFAPNPGNGAKWIDPNLVLSWQPGQDATTHDVYFGTDKNLVASRDPSTQVGKDLVDASVELPLLQPGTTYYWVVDETDTGNPGDVWSFITVVPGTIGVKAEYFNGMALSGAPFLTQIEPGINNNWGANGPTATVVDTFSARYTADLQILTADTYTFIGTSDDGIRGWLNDTPLWTNSWVDRGTTDSFSAPIHLDPGIYSLVVEYYENTGGAVCEVSWQTPTMARQIIPAGPLQLPVRAKPSNPQNGDVNVPQDVTLRWSAGQNAVTHDVYFGTDANAIAAATPANASLYKGSQAKDEITFAPGTLQWNTTYYWRVDEVNAANAQSPWTGDVWKFTTADFLVVDDFESYTDEDVGRIFQTWIDGWGFTTPAPGDPGNGTSSTVGYVDPPFAEHSIIHGGGSSMPFDYNNFNQPFYSETDRTFATAQNWKANGVNTLVLYFQGYPAKFINNGTTITMSSAGSDIWNAADEFRFAYMKLTGDGSITAKVNSIAQTDVWAKAGVMVRESFAPGSANAANVVSAASGVSFQYRELTDGASLNVGQTALVAPYWVRLTRTGNTFKAEESADGKAWTSVGTDATLSSHDVIMASSVYIGLCVTSHNTNPKIATTGVFSDIKTTGGVSGSWQVADIGIASPGNDPDTLYVALQDSAGKIAVVNNPDAQAVLSTTWTAWNIPTSSFTSVNLGAIKKMYIGVGNRNAPKVSGHGKLFIDDIRVIKQ